MALKPAYGAECRFSNLKNVGSATLTRLAKLSDFPKASDASKHYAVLSRMPCGKPDDDDR